MNGVFWCPNLACRQEVWWVVRRPTGWHVSDTRGKTFEVAASIPVCVLCGVTLVDRRSDVVLESAPIQSFLETLSL